MSWRLTPEERRIIERTRREGEQQTPPNSEPKGQMWRSVAVWSGGIVLFVVLAMVMVYIGSHMGRG